jgi:hypothetical protein
MNGRGASMALAASAVVALLALPAGGAAKGKKKVKPPPPVVSATAAASTSSDGQIVTPTAVCPPGTVALGGGFSGEVGREAGAPTDLYVVQESRRDSPTSWHIEAAREDKGTQLGNPISITVAVYCQSPKLGKAKKRKKHRKPKRRHLLISEVSATGPLAGQGAQSTATASCPAGLNAISGGYSVSPAPDLTQTYPRFPLVWADHASSAQAWTASERTFGTTAMTLTSYAYCANTSPALALAGSGSVSAEQTGSATTPPCARNRPLIGGGFDNAQATPGGTAEVAFESIGSAGGWKTSAFNVVGGAPASLRAIAYCR